MTQSSAAAAAWSAVASAYDVESSASTSSLIRHAIGLVLPLLPPAGAEQARILDVCCGSGQVALVLAAQGYEVLATDVAEGMVRVLKEKAAGLGLSQLLTTAVMDASDLRVPAGSFDAAFMAFALFIMPDPQAALTAMAAAVRPGGLVVLTQWSPQDESQFHHVLGRVLQAQGRPTASLKAAMSRNNDRQQLSPLLAAAGLELLEAQSVTAQSRVFLNPRDYLQQLRIIPGPPVSAEQRKADDEAAVRAIAEMFGAKAQFRLTFKAITFIARKL